MLPSQIAVITVIAVAFFIASVVKLYHFVKRHYGKHQAIQVFPKPEYKGKHEKS